MQAWLWMVWYWIICISLSYFYNKIVKQSLNFSLKALEEKTSPPKFKFEHFNKVIELAKNVDDITNCTSMGYFLKWYATIQEAPYSNII